jgi:hypothetical protein
MNVVENQTPAPVAVETQAVNTPGTNGKAKKKRNRQLKVTPSPLTTANSIYSNEWVAKKEVIYKSVADYNARARHDNAPMHYMTILLFTKRQDPNDSYDGGRFPKECKTSTSPLIQGVVPGDNDEEKALNFGRFVLFFVTNNLF